MSSPTSPRKNLGRVMIACGLCVIVVSVLFVLEAANGPGTGPKTFAERRSYNQVKESVHATFPWAFLVAMAGLGLSIAGARLGRPEAGLPEDGRSHP